MNLEILSLSILSILYLLAFLPSSLGKAKYYGQKWLASNRSLKDGQQEFHLLNNWGARSERAYRNLQTNYPPFAVAIVLLITLQLTTKMTGILSLVYLICRIGHFVSYMIGFVAPRALFWGLAWGINIYFFVYMLKNYQ